MAIVLILFIVGLVITPLILIFVGFIRYILYKSNKDQQQYKNGSIIMLVGLILIVVEFLIGFSICSSDLRI